MAGDAPAFKVADASRRGPARDCRVVLAIRIRAYRFSRGVPMKSAFPSSTRCARRIA